MTDPRHAEPAVLGRLLAGRRWVPAAADAAAARLVAATPLLGVPEAQIWHVELPDAGGVRELQLIVGPGASGELVDLFDEPTALLPILARMRADVDVEGETETVRFRATDRRALLDALPATARTVPGEQSNSAAVFGERLLLKAYRRPRAGTHPEPELLELLADHGFAGAPRLVGWYERDETTLGIVETYIADGQDGWEVSRAWLRSDDDVAAPMRLLGRTVAAMSQALAAAPGEGDHRTDDTRARARAAADALAHLAATIPALGAAVAGARRLASAAPPDAAPGAIGRVHGDLHLGQTLWAEGRWFVVDFEGAPTETLAERRRPDTPLRDLASILRSVDYAAAAAGCPPARRDVARGAVLDGYAGAFARDPSRLAADPLLRVLELERAIHEVRYEQTYRPGWMHIPIRAILDITDE